MTSASRVIRVIDSHTGGEPTRVVIAGGPDLGCQSVATQLVNLRTYHDDLRRLCIHEPRGGEVWVGALLCQPADPACAVGVIFFNNVGYIGMCGHGTIGLVATLAHLARLGDLGRLTQIASDLNLKGDGSTPCTLKIETPVGIVEASWLGRGKVAVTNVASRRIAKDVSVEVPGLGVVCGDVAWSGNGFFLVKDWADSITPSNLTRLTSAAKRIRKAINDAGYPEVDHIELFGPPTVPGAHSRNFVLCPGGAFDRSPCGTGTSAKLACLAADGTLKEGEIWVQESIIGTTFEASFQWQDRDAGIIVPTITGTAFITAQSDLMVDPLDPFPSGLGDLGERS